MVKSSAINDQPSQPKPQEVKIPQKPQPEKVRDTQIRTGGNDTQTSSMNKHFAKGTPPKPATPPPPKPVIAPRERGIFEEQTPKP